MRSGVLAVLVLCIGSALSADRYVGKSLGALSQLEHGVRGNVFAVDARTLYIQGFFYDGEGPAAYFYVGSSGSPSATGATRLRDDRGSTNPLRKYRGEGIALSLPDNLTLKDVRWFAVWCDEYSVNFGDVRIPRDLEYPKPAKVGALRGVHGVSSDPVVVVDAQTLLVPNFSYDGEAPDAKFWVGRGSKPSPAGVRIPDENGKEAPLRKYDRKTIVLTLPGELTVFDIGHFGVWCEAFTVDFGHVQLPREQLANVPPSLKMLGVSPQSKLNCEVLYDDLAFEVRWAVAGDSIVLQLVSKLEDGEYMSFGISGDPHHSQMVGGDVAVAWVDKTTLKGFAVDYYLDAKSQCAGVRGSCPDEVFVDGTNSIRLLNAALVNGYSIVTFQRSLKAADELDLAFLTNSSQPIIWAIGPLNSKNEVSYHHHFTKGDKFIEFGRPPVWNCPMPEGEDEREQEPIRPKPQPAEQPIKPNPVPTPKPTDTKVVPWEIPPIQCNEPEDGVFYAQMGPTGGKQGYPAITGHVGWGISWYINGLLIPEINVVRGRKYTFVTEGGEDASQPARYHPFYITNDPVGGYFHKTEAEKQGVEIYAGVRRSRTGELIPTGIGRLCNWTPNKDGPEADEYPSFGAYQRSLTLVCEQGDPGVITWTPDKHTPDTVYYQCFTHRHLGWKINVVDECDALDSEESRVVERVVAPDLLGEESVQQVHSRVKPDNQLEHKRLEKIINSKTPYNDFSSDKLTGEVRYRPEPSNQLYQEYGLPIGAGQIRDVIDVVENLESSMPHQYQVHEDVKEFLPEQPMREGDEYVIEPGKMPENYLLQPNQKPITLQAVLRPGSNAPPGMGHPFRKTPPELKLRRPPPNMRPPHPDRHQSNPGYPLSMPTHSQKKKYMNRGPPVRPPNTSNYGHLPLKPLSPQGKPLPPQVKPLVPHKPLKPGFSHSLQPPVSQVPSGPVQGIIMGRPSMSSLSNIQPPIKTQTLSLGKSDIIANHVVKSQITLPGLSDLVIAQPSEPQLTISRPGQIILGKPMENPVPLDQQMAPNRPRPEVMRPRPTTEPPRPTNPPRIRIKPVESLPGNTETDMKSSDFMGQSVDPTPLAPAVNTGFKPDSIVVESGFKPIIREPLMASEDRITNFGDSSNRRQDTDVEEDYVEAPQGISLPTSSQAYPPSETLTQSFEPMFIPSPLDHISENAEKATTTELFPSNHAKEERPYPFYVQDNDKTDELFSEKNMEKDVPDMVMESDRVSPQYLPPDPKSRNKPQSIKQAPTPEQTFTTYDGKTVSGATLVSVPAPSIISASTSGTKLFSSKVPSVTELLLKKPQFGPYKGDLPTEVVEQLQKDKASKSPLKVVGFEELNKEDETDALKAEESKIDEVTVSSSQSTDDDENMEYDDDEEEEEEEAGEQSSNRQRRDTKDTLFERGEVEEQPATVGVSSIKNQVDFDVGKKTISNTAAHTWSTNLVKLSNDIAETFIICYLFDYLLD
ncbi:protein Skeletor, isoforms D/E isoform X2 [Leguminivora glycinivorella]|uniref:protein Skeletor, isoforms D/E isoform X2 n=1 Tax=Leguminivora glycinivorella TaxID=1035111 RepID=UPI00200D868C|nr:protein Skeletor, isoforms D/E isoform X2 [Leguminivora glycinivorella]